MVTVLELLTKKLNLGNNIIFTCKIENKYLPQFYATADLFVGPSIVTKSGDTEGLGVVFLEALASGTCVIGSDVGGIPDIIKHNRTGILVKQKDSKQLAEAIIKLLSNQKLRKNLAINGQKYIEQNYSWELIGKKFNELIQKIK